METNSLDPNDQNRGRIRNNPSGRVLGGSILVIIGLLFMAKQMHLDLPYWLFRWPMLMIGIGFYVGARHSFRAGGWMIVVLIGSVFLFEDIFYDLDVRHFLWPMILISIGLFMIFRPRRSFGSWDSQPSTTEDGIDVTSVFSGTKKNIISKNFKGGVVSNMFGGSDINLMQADINGTVVIDITTFFGGTKLVVPAHWNLRSEIATIFGGVEDKRHFTNEGVDLNKTLVLRGTCVFSGIEIKTH